MKAAVLAALAAATLVATASDQTMPPVNNLASLPQPKPTPANLLPTGIVGSVVYVHNLEAERNWYQTLLGMKVRTPYARDGKVFEYILAIGDGAPMMGLAQNDLRPAGMNTNSRVVLSVPDPKALSAYLMTMGAYVREAVPGTAYMVYDPEGNQIELYKAPAVTPAPAAKR